MTKESIKLPIRLISDAVIIMEAARKVGSIIANYAAAPFVFVDGFAEGFLLTSPTTNQVALDSSTVAGVEEKISKTLQNQQLLKSMNEAYEATYQALKSKIEKGERAMMKDGGVGDSLLVLHKFNHEIHGRLAKRVIKKSGNDAEKVLSDASNNLVINQMAIQNGAMVGVHRLGQALGALFSDLQKKFIAIEIDPEYYTTYAAVAYLRKEVIHTVSKALSLPRDIVLVGLTGFAEGLIEEERVAIDQAMKAAASKTTVQMIDEAVSRGWNDFLTSYNSSMKKRSGFDQNLREGGVESVLAVKPFSARKSMEFRGRGVMLGAKVGSVNVGENALWAGDVAVSAARALGAVGSKLVYSGMKHIGSGVAHMLGRKKPSESPEMEDPNKKQVGK